MAESNHDEMSIFFFLTEIHIEYKSVRERHKTLYTTWTINVIFSEKAP